MRRFYEHAPFPGYPPRDSLTWLRARAERSEFARLLDRAIPGDARILEIGCGTGQMSLYLARADRIVIGADLTRASLLLGAAAARRFGLDRVQFVETDLRQPRSASRLVRRRLLVGRFAPHARPARFFCANRAARAARRNDRRRTLQCLRPHSAAAAPADRALIGISLDSVRSGAARSRE